MQTATEVDSFAAKGVWRGDARLYELSDPFPFVDPEGGPEGDSQETSFVVSSALTDMESSYDGTIITETVVFPTDADGVPLADVSGPTLAGVADHRKALESLGYVLVDDAQVA